MENTNILVVDDERKIRDLVRLYLEKEGFNVGEADDGQKALNIYQQGQYELIVLDLMMPGMDGWEVCKEVRRKSNVPIIMLTALKQLYYDLAEAHEEMEINTMKPQNKKEMKI